jgi:selenocysteine-specific elongation factor
MLLVVAADEGVKPQTREHLDICAILGIPAALVALTKIDLASPDLVELAELEVTELLSSSPFAHAPVFPVSAHTGEGIEALRSQLVELGRNHAAQVAPQRPARLPVDRSFHLKGRGVLVTGTLVNGIVKTGQELEVLPAGSTGRIRSIQVHGQDRDQAQRGERTSLQLAGLALEELERGFQLVEPGSLGTTTNLLASFTLLPSAKKSLTGWTPVRFHLLASQVLGRLRPLEPQRLEPGESGTVEIRLEGPVPAIRSDRFVIRIPSPATTLGGGSVLDPQWSRKRGTRRRRAIAELSRNDDAATQHWIREAGEGGVTAQDLARRLGLSHEALVPLLQDQAREGRLLKVEEGTGRQSRWLSPAAYQRMVERARQVLDEHFRKHRLSLGMAKAEAVRRLFRGPAAETADIFLQWMEAQGILQVRGDQVTLPGRQAELSEEESGLAREILERIQEHGLTPPSPREICEDLQAHGKICEGLLGYLIDKGRLKRMPNGLILSTQALDQLRSDLRSSGWSRFSVAQFKERYELSRKWAIPLLELLDAQGITRRVGEERQIVGSGGSQ